MNETISHTPEQFLMEQGVVNKETKELAISKAHESYLKILELIDFYLDMPEEHAKIIALWIIGTYVHKEFNSFPFLFINAMRGSGKSRLLNFIAHTAWNGKLTNNITESVLFRTAQSHTLVIDEIESIIKKEKSAMRELLNSAYKKGTHVERMKKIKHGGGEDLVVEKFELYTPIAMANINGMDEVTSDRCIPIILEKSDNPIKVKLMEDFDSDEFKGLKDTLNSIKVNLVNVLTTKNIKKEWNKYILDRYSKYTSTLSTQCSLYTLSTLTTTIDPILLSIFNRINETNINGRNLEIFFPLLLLSSLLDDSLFNEILSIAKTHVNQKIQFEQEDSPDISLYKFIATKDPLSWYPIKDLIMEFKSFYSSDDSDRDWLNNHWLARALRRLKLVVQSRRRNEGVQFLLDISKAQLKSDMFKQLGENDGEI